MAGALPMSPQAAAEPQSFRSGRDQPVSIIEPRLADGLGPEYCQKRQQWLSVEGEILTNGGVLGAKAFYL